MFVISVSSRRGCGHMVAFDLLRVVCQVRAVVIERRRGCLVQVAGLMRLAVGRFNCRNSGSGIGRENRLGFMLSGVLLDQSQRFRLFWVTRRVRLACIRGGIKKTLGRKYQSESERLHRLILPLGLLILLPGAHHERGAVAVG